MFTKISRYYALPEVTSLDAQGRLLPSKKLRLLPAVSASFQHTVKAVDRLDHLAYQYYKQPRKWWKICDANAEVMSPQALLGHLPLMTQKFGLPFKDEPPPWYLLQQKLLNTAGVETVHLVEERQLITITQQDKPVHLEKYLSALVITSNQTQITTEVLKAMIALEVNIENDEISIDSVERIGKPIFIPPDNIKPVDYGV